MHPAWQIDDIRRLIFERLERQQLARLAQTCKALFAFATDELWGTINSLSPLLCCLPPDFRRRALRAEDIQRLDLYATKVQNLVLDSRNVQVTIPLPPPFRLEKGQPKTKKGEPKATKGQPNYIVPKSWAELWNEIAELRPASEFLPNICRIHISNTVEELLIPLIGISGSNLIGIRIKYIQNRQPESVVLKVLDQLQETPKLECLFVRDGEPDLVPAKLIQQSPLRQLRLDPRISAHKYGPLIFKQSPLRYEIIQKSTLENLTIGLTREWYTPGIKALESKCLPALKTLWLNLTAFKPALCKESCLNITPHSWTCVSDGRKHDLNQHGATDCGRRSPTCFLKGLDSPELSLLNIKFPGETTGQMLLDVVSAANSSCRLRNLTELALAGGKWIGQFNSNLQLPARNINPRDLRKALRILLPMAQLKILRLSVAPNFLDVLDLQLYRSIADGLPALQKLWIGDRDFFTSYFRGDPTDHDKVSLHHLAAFCSLLPNLVEAGMGAVDGLSLEEKPRTEWACVSVKSLMIQHWASRHVARGPSRDLLHLCLAAYFPNADLTKGHADSEMWILEEDE